MTQKVGCGDGSEVLQDVGQPVWVRGGQDCGGIGKLKVSGVTPIPNGKLLTSSSTKHNAHKVGMGVIGNASNTGRSGPQGSGNVIQGCDISGTTLWE